MPVFGLVDRAELAALRDRLTRLDPASVATSDNPSVVFTAHDALHPLIRLYLLGLTSAHLGDPDRALRYAEQLEGTELPATAGSLSSDLAHSVRSAVHHVAGRLEEALAELELARSATWYGQTMASPLYCLVFDRFARAELLLELGRDREALDWYAHLVETSPFETPYLALSHLRQAETYYRLGDMERAASHYEAFAELWSEADPGFQLRVSAARERLSEIAAARDSVDVPPEP